MEPRASFFWARIMRTVLNEKHSEVLEHLRRDSRSLVSMLSALAAHAASETECGPLLWEMLTDEELAELAAGKGAGRHVAASLVSSLELASDKDDDEAISVGARLIVSMLELGHRISPHFRNEMVHLVPEVLRVLSGVDPARLGVSIADILLAVLCPSARDVGSPDSRLGWDENGPAGDLDAGGTMVEEPVAQACQQAVLALLQRFLAIGQKDGTSLVRRRRRETSFQFTVMRPRGGARRGVRLGDTTSVADIRQATNEHLVAAQRVPRPEVAMNSTARERRIAFAEERGAATAVPRTTPLRVGTADLAAVRAVGRLLQGGSDEWGYCSWIAQQFASLGLGECPHQALQSIASWTDHSLNKTGAGHRRCVRCSSLRIRGQGTRSSALCREPAH